MLGAIGIILSVAVFIFLAFKGVNLVVTAIISACIMILTSGLPLYAVLTGTYTPEGATAATGYMTYFAGFLKSYFFLFVLSSLLGRVMSDGGAARRIALGAATLVEKASDNNKKLMCVLIVPLLYFVLSFVGISGFVLVFTVMPIAKDLFEKTDTPWRFYCFGGVQAIAAGMLAGNLSAVNIFAAKACGTPTTAAAGLSIVAVLVWLVVTFFLIKIMLKKALANGEDFMVDGAAVKASASSAVMADKDLPNFWISILPLVAVIVLSSAFKMTVEIALCIGCVMGIVLFWKNIGKQLNATLTNGVTSCFGAIIVVAATFAMGSIIKITPTYTIILNGLSNLPGVFGGSILITVMSFVIASSSSSVAAFGAPALELYTNAGISAAIAHRMMTISAFAGIPPHSAGIANAMAVTKISYKRCLKVYMMGVFIPGIFTFVVSLALVALGVF